MNHESHSANALIAFLFGVSVGAIGGLLLAPTSGRKLRKQIDKKSRRLKQRAVATAEDLRDRSGEAAERIGDIVADTKDNITSKVRRA